MKGLCLLYWCYHYNETFSGREFHNLGAAKEKHLWEKFISLIDGTFSKFLKEDSWLKHRAREVQYCSCGSKENCALWAKCPLSRLRCKAYTCTKALFSANHASIAFLYKIQELLVECVRNDLSCSSWLVDHLYWATEWLMDCSIVKRFLFRYTWNLSEARKALKLPSLSENCLKCQHALARIAPNPNRVPSPIGPIPFVYIRYPMNCICGTLNLHFSRLWFNPLLCNRSNDSHEWLDLYSGTSWQMKTVMFTFPCEVITINLQLRLIISVMSKFCQGFYFFYFWDRKRSF